MKTFEALLGLIDESTGMIPEKTMDLVVARLSDKPATQPSPVAQPVPLPRRADLDLTSLSLEDAIYRLMEDAQDTYFTPDRAWSARRIYHMLESRGYPFPQGIDAAINAVSTALIRMTEKEVLVRRVKGSGRNPSLYTWVRAEYRPVTTIRSYSGEFKLSDVVVDPANVGGFGGFSTDLYDATRNGIKGGAFGTLAGFSVPSFDEFAKQKEKEKEDSEESS